MPALTGKSINTNTVLLGDRPACKSLWCKCSLSAFKIPFKDLVFINLLIIAKNVSIIGNKNTINGAIITIAVYVLAIPNIDVIAIQYPKKLDPVSPINVFAGAKLNGKNPTNAPINDKWQLCW